MVYREGSYKTQIYENPAYTGGPNNLYHLYTNGFPGGDCPTGILIKKPKTLDADNNPVFTFIDDQVLENIQSTLQEISNSVGNEVNIEWPLQLNQLVNLPVEDLYEIHDIFAGNIEGYNNRGSLNRGIVAEALNYGEIIRRARALGLEDEPSNPFPVVLGIGSAYTENGGQALSLVMQELEGCFDLDKYIEQIIIGNNGLTEQWQKYLGLENLFTSLAKAFDFCHRIGVAHKDLKPSNIKISKSGKAYFIDMATAYFLEQPADRISWSASYNFVPPEFFATFYTGGGFANLSEAEIEVEIRKRQIDLDYHKFDTFSFAIAAMEMLSGVQAHNRGNLIGSDSGLDIVSALNQDNYTQDYDGIITGFKESAIIRLASRLMLNKGQRTRLVKALSQGCTFDPKDRAPTPAQLCGEIATLFASFNTV